MDKIDKYLRRYKKARSTADLWISLLEACYHYTIPSRNLFYWTSQYQGAQKNARVYDTTAVAGVRDGVSKIQMALTPPGQNWALLEAGDEIPEEEQEKVNKYLQKTTDTIFNFLRRSNCDLVLNESYYDLFVGTAALLIHETDNDDKPFHFYSVPMARLAIEQNESGRLQTAFRWWDEIRISDIKLLFPGATLTVEMEKQLELDPTATVKNLIEGTLYFDKRKRPYSYVLFLENERTILLDQQQESSPWIIFRWSKVPNEVMGRGPVIEALPSILSLNEIARFELLAANMNICKPYMGYSDGIFNPWTFVLEPNTIIPIAPNMNGQYPLVPLPDVTNPAFLQLTSNDLRMQINKLLYANPLGPIEAPQKTATELVLRQKNLAEEIGPAFTRLQQEFLGPFIQRIVYILKRRGLIENLEINGKEVQIRYKSPLVAAQGQQEVQKFLQFYEILQSIQGPEQALLNVNPAKLPTWLANKLAVDPTVLNDEEQMEKFYSENSEQFQDLMLMMGDANGQQQQPIQGQSLPSAA